MTASLDQRVIPHNLFFANPHKFCAINRVHEFFQLDFWQVMLHSRCILPAL
jgi:hypothetical protein